MNKPFYFLVLLALASCQQPAAKEAQAVAAPPVTPITTPAKPALATAAQPAPEMQEFLRKFEVGKLLLLNDGPLNGFMGADHYRVELVFSEVVRDSSHANRYWVRGKSRFKKTITPMAGYITLDQVQDQPRLTKKKQGQSGARAQHADQLPAYSALGRFQLREDSLQRGAGTFAGEVVIDFVVGQDGQLSIETQSPQTPSQDAGIKLEGSWTSYATGQKKPVVLAYYIWAYGESVLKNFNVGERGPEINPKYAKLGWDDFWDNEEWWVDPAAVTAQAVSDST
jgi:hypothetical protein